MKKFLFVFIPFLICAAVLLCGCGNDSNESETTEITETSAVSETVPDTSEDTGNMSVYEDESEDSADFGALFG